MHFRARTHPVLLTAPLMPCLPRPRRTRRRQLSYHNHCTINRVMAQALVNQRSRLNQDYQEIDVNNTDARRIYERSLADSINSSPNTAVDCCILLRRKVVGRD